MQQKEPKYVLVYSTRIGKRKEQSTELSEKIELTKLKANQFKKR